MKLNENISEEYLQCVLVYNFDAFRDYDVKSGCVQNLTLVLGLNGLKLLENGNFLISSRCDQSRVEESWMIFRVN